MDTKIFNMYADNLFAVKISDAEQEKELAGIVSMSGAKCIPSSVRKYPVAYSFLENKSSKIIYLLPDRADSVAATKRKIVDFETMKREIIKNREKKYSR